MTNDWEDLPELPLNFFEARYVELARRIAPPKGDGKFGYTPVVQRRKGGRGWSNQELIDGLKLMSFVATRLSESPDVRCLSIFRILLISSCTSLELGFYDAFVSGLNQSPD